MCVINTAGAGCQQTLHIHMAVKLTLFHRALLPTTSLTIPRQALHNCALCGMAKLKLPTRTVTNDIYWSPQASLRFDFSVKRCVLSKVYVMDPDTQCKILRSEIPPPQDMSKPQRLFSLTESLPL